MDSRGMRALNADLGDVTIKQISAWLSVELLGLAAAGLDNKGSRTSLHGGRLLLLGHRAENLEAEIERRGRALVWLADRVCDAWISPADVIEQAMAAADQHGGGIRARTTRDDNGRAPDRKRQTGKVACPTNGSEDGPATAEGER